MKKLIVTFLSIVLSVCALCIFTNAASEGTAGSQATYRIVTEGDSKTLYLEGQMATSDYTDDGMAPFSEYSNAVTKIVIDPRITKIGDYTFAGFTALKEVTIPAECKVGDYAFKDCTALETLTLSNNSEKIGQHAFMGCTSLSEIKAVGDYTISYTARIASNAFSGCNSLVKVTIPRSLTIIEDHAFAYCTSLNEVNFHNSVTRIRDYAFKNCTSLEGINLPGSLKEIGNYAFANCYALKTFSFPSQITTVSNRVFENCTSLKSVVFADGTTEIGEYAFNGCTLLDTISIPASVKSIGQYAFKNCTSLPSVTVPNGVVWIQNGTFLGCTSLSSVSLSDSVKHIGQNAFSGCSNLSSIELPVNLIGINKNAFYGCSALSGVVIPKSVQYIKGYAFVNSGVKSLVVLSENTSVGDYAFGLYLDYDSEGVVSDAVIYAPDASLAKYYANDNGVSFASLASYTGTIADKYSNAASTAAASKLLAYRNGDTSVSRIVIAGKPITDFEIVYQPMQSSHHKYISEAAKMVGEAVSEKFGVTLERKEYADTVLTDGKNKIYLSLSLEINGADTSKGVNYSYTGIPIDGKSCDDYIAENYGIKLGNGDFVIFEHNGDLYIHACGYQGLHYAGAEFRESYLGFRYYIGNDIAAATEFIDNGFIFEIPSGLLDYQSAIIQNRDAQSQGYIGETNTATQTAAYRKISSWKNRGAFVKDERYGGGVGYVGDAHTFITWLNTSYGASWWYNQNPSVWNGEGWNPCLTNSGVLDKMINAVIQGQLVGERSSYFDNTLQSISVAQADTPNWCTCPACSALAAKEGQSGVVLKFVNEVADRVSATDYNSTKIWTLAYSNARYAPKTIIPRDNVIVCYAWQGCNNHTFTSNECTETTYGTSNPADRAEFEKWNSITENMYVWLYPVSYSFYMAPSHEIYNILEDVKYLADHNVYGVYFEDNYGDSVYGDGYSFEALQAYMHAKVLWDPYMSEAEYVKSMKEFLKFYYGAGYEDIYNFSKLDETAKDVNGCYVNNWEWPFDTYSFEYMAENFDDMMQLLDSARAKATTDAQRTNIDKMTAHVLFLGLSATNENNYANGTDAQKTEYKARYDRLVTILKTNNMTIGHNNQNVPASASDIDYSQMPYEWYGLPRLHRVQYDIRKYTEELDKYRVEIEAIMDKLDSLANEQTATSAELTDINQLKSDAQELINKIDSYK